MIHQVGHRQQLGSVADDAQAGQGIADLSVINCAQRIAFHIHRQCHRITHRGRTQNGQNQVWTGRNAPAPQSQAKILFGLGNARLRGNVQYSAQAENGVCGKPEKAVDCLLTLELQHAVDERPGIPQIAKEIAYAFLRELGRSFCIDSGRRLQKRPVDGIVETENAAVPRFQRVARMRVRPCGTSGQQKTGQYHSPANSGTDQPKKAGVLHLPFPFCKERAGVPAASSAPPDSSLETELPASSALLFMNWPIRFSRTTADCVLVTSSPCFHKVSP